MYLTLNSINKLFTNTKKETLKDISLTVEKANLFVLSDHLDVENQRY